MTQNKIPQEREKELKFLEYLKLWWNDDKGWYELNNKIEELKAGVQNSLKDTIKSRRENK